jgi:hypothetical protein
MRHNLKISVAKEAPLPLVPDSGGIVRCRRISLRERVLKCLLGEVRRVTIIVPGDSVKALSLQEVPEVGSHGGA